MCDETKVITSPCKHNWLDISSFFKAAELQYFLVLFAVFLQGLAKCFHTFHVAVLLFLMLLGTASTKRRIKPSRSRHNSEKQAGAPHDTR